MASKSNSKTVDVTVKTEKTENSNARNDRGPRNRGDKYKNRGNNGHGRSNNKSGKNGGQPKKDSDSKRDNYDNIRADKMAAVIRRAMTNKGHNDFGWYNRNPELIKAAASIPFASILGIGANGGATNAVPGILAIGWMPAFGSGSRPIAMNQASDSIYSKIVHANSRDYQQTAPDYMIVNIAGIQVFSILSAAIRAFRTIKLYREENAYIPDSLLKAMGCDPVDFRGNQSRIWFDLNDFINQIQQIWIPNVFPLMERWFWLNSNVYTDAPGARSQMYVFVQERYFMFSETLATTGSSLITVPVNGMGSIPFEPGPSNQYTWAEWKTTIQAMIDALVDSEDRGEIYGNILNAYGAENLYHLAPVDSGEVLEPIFNAEVLCQIEGLVQVDPKFAPMGLVQVEEDLFPVMYKFKSSDAQVPCVPISMVLNEHIAEQPTQEVIVESTRLSTCGVSRLLRAVVSSNSIPTAQWTPQAMDAVWGLSAVGSEIVVDMQAILRNDAGDYITTKINSWISASAEASILPYFGRIMAFDWHPFLYYGSQPYYSNPAANTVEVHNAQDIFGDYDNYTTLTAAELQRIHDACIFSLWGVPHI